MEHIQDNFLHHNNNLIQHNQQNHNYLQINNRQTYYIHYYNHMMFYRICPFQFPSTVNPQSPYNGPLCIPDRNYQVNLGYFLLRSYASD